MKVEAERRNQATTSLRLESMSRLVFSQEQVFRQTRSCAALENEIAQSFVKWRIK